MTIVHPGAIAVHRHTYGSHSEQFGELRLPPGDGPHPAIVYVHGGGWQAAITLAGSTGIVRSLTAHGYATWSIEYRRLGVRPKSGIRQRGSGRTPFNRRA